MTQQLYDKEIRLHCTCGDPHHFIHIGFNCPDHMFEKNYLGQPELYFSYQAYQGSLWKRIKKAWKIITGGWIDYEATAEIEGKEEMLRLFNFLQDCIDMIGTKAEKKPPAVTVRKVEDRYIVVSGKGGSWHEVKEDKLEKTVLGYLEEG